jgi:hypothetical protein
MARPVAVLFSGLLPALFTLAPIIPPVRAVTVVAKPPAVRTFPRSAPVIWDNAFSVCASSRPWEGCMSILSISIVTIFLSFPHGYLHISSCRISRAYIKGILSSANLSDNGLMEEERVGLWSRGGTPLATLLNYIFIYSRNGKTYANTRQFYYTV